MTGAVFTGLAAARWAFSLVFLASAFILCWEVLAAATGPATPATMRSLVPVWVVTVLAVAATAATEMAATRMNTATGFMAILLSLQKKQARTGSSSGNRQGEGRNPLYFCSMGLPSWATNKSCMSFACSSSTRNMSSIMLRVLGSLLAK